MASWTALRYAYAQKFGNVRTDPKPVPKPKPATTAHGVFDRVLRIAWVFLQLKHEKREVSHCFIYPQETFKISLRS